VFCHAWKLANFMRIFWQCQIALPEYILKICRENSREEATGVYNRRHAVPGTYSPKSDSMTEFRAEVQRVCKNFFTTMAGCGYSALPLIRRQEISPRSLRARCTAYSSSVAILVIYYRRDSPASTRYQDTPHFPRPRINIGPSQRSKWKYARSNSDLRYWILFAGCHTLPHVLVRATSLLGEGFLTEGRNTLHALMRFH